MFTMQECLDLCDVSDAAVEKLAKRDGIPFACAAYLACGRSGFEAGAANPTGPAMKPVRPHGPPGRSQPAANKPRSVRNDAPAPDEPRPDQIAVRRRGAHEPC